MEPTKKQVEGHEHDYVALPSNKPYDKSGAWNSRTMVCKTCDKPSSVKIQNVPKKGK